jgi:hypothetical protein
MPVRITLFVLLGAGLLSAAAAQAPAASDETAQRPPSGSVAAPNGFNPPSYNITGVRSSINVATAVHCTNLGPGSVSVYVDFFDFNGSFVCGTSMTGLATGGTASFATANTQVFVEDSFCATIPAIGQGRAAVSTVPTHGPIICSAELVGIVGNPPAALSALDVYPAQ